MRDESKETGGRHIRKEWKEEWKQAKNEEREVREGQRQIKKDNGNERRLETRIE